ncbi:hypothetical protein M2140_000119 [Clostridiales Family XIII bacterium PM5-7]
MLAKWFYENGAKTVLDIRNKLKEWATENDFYLTVAMNPVATRVITGDMKLLGTSPIYINDEDVKLIKNRFDTEKERLVALSILCYAKAYADKKKEFRLSKNAFSLWVGIDKKTTRKYINEAIDVEYITLCDKGSINSWYQTTVVSQLGTYKIEAPLENSGQYELVDNNIYELYDLIFEGIDQTQEVWYGIPEYNDWYQISNMGRVKVCERIVGDRVFKSKILKPYKSSSGKEYIYMYSDQKKQERVCLEKLKRVIATD